MGESGGSAERQAKELRARGMRSAGAWAAGADGERRVAAALAPLPTEWLVLHDRLLMPGLADSNLDHLLVGPAGVVLIDAKNWAGHIGEWNGAVYQHSTTQGGSRQHRPVDRHFAGLQKMATEVARRTGHPVLTVICLAGRQADDFGEPRIIHGVWVVPIARLVDFLTTRPLAPIADRERLGVHVMTEFPSTTTDAGLLVAMGHALDPYRGVDTRRGRRRPAPVPPAAAAHLGNRLPPARSTGTRRARRRGSRTRPLLSLLGVVLLLVSLHTGTFQAFASRAGSVISDYLVSGMQPTTTRPAPTLPAIARPQNAAGVGTVRTNLSCDAFDPADHKPLAKLKLEAKETALGCVWSIPSTKSSAPSVEVVKIIEDVTTFRLNPMFTRSSEDKAPVLTKGWDIGGWHTTVWVAKGVKVKSGTRTATSRRYVTVIVGHEALKQSEKQGRALALAITRVVSSRPVPG